VYPYLTAVPTIAVISDYAGGAGGQHCDIACGTGWFFSHVTTDWEQGVGIGKWIYSVGASVPLPASLPLVLAGLGALGLTRRRRKA